MSMSLAERRIQVIDQMEFPGGRVRLVKASSRYDRRHRYWAIDLLRPAYVGHELEDYMWTVVQSWPVSQSGTESEARAAFTTTWLTVRALSDTSNQEQHP